MHFNRLLVFLSVAKHLSVTKAAQELHISQPALSQHLKLLQERYGVLLRRKGHGLELTERGWKLFNEIEPIVLRIAAIDAKFAAERGEIPAEKLILGGSHAPSTSLLPDLMLGFKREHPCVELQLKTAPSGAIQELVLNSELELAVVTHPSPSPFLEMEPCCEFKLSLFVAANHPLAEQREVSLEVLASYPLVFGRTHTGHHRSDGLVSSMRKKGLKPNILAHCEWPDAVKALVRTGEAVGLLYHDIIAPAISDRAFKMIKVTGVNLTAVGYIIYRKKTPLSRPAHDFLALLRSIRSRPPFRANPRVLNTKAQRPPLDPRTFG